MRRLALGTLLVAAGVAAFSAATALATHQPEAFDQGLTLAGGSDAPARASTSAVIDDPDAPIATARYGGERSSPTLDQTPTPPALATVALAGGPAEVGLAGAPKPALVAAVAKAEPRQASARAMIAVAPSGRPVLTLTKLRPARPYGKVLQASVNDQPLAFTPLGLQSGAVKRLTLNASSLMSKASASAEDLRRGRWMLFAASSGKAYGLNLIRDSLGGWRNAGVSEERLARFGSRQVGLGYRKGDSQVSLSATQRKFRAIDYSDKDTVVGVTVSVRAR